MDHHPGGLIHNGKFGIVEDNLQRQILRKRGPCGLSRLDEDSLFDFDRLAGLLGQFPLDPHSPFANQPLNLASAPGRHSQNQEAVQAEGPFLFSYGELKDFGSLEGHLERKASRISNPAPMVIALSARLKVGQWC